jgi:hypothetical protein
MSVRGFAHHRGTDLDVECERAGHLSTGTGCPARDHRLLSGGANG